MNTTKTAQFTQGPWELSSTHRDEQYIDEPKAEELRPLFRIHWDNDVTDHEAEQGATLIAAAPAMYEALETVPLPKHNEAIGEFYTRFYTWYEGQVKQVLSQAEGRQA